MGLRTFAAWNGLWTGRCLASGNYHVRDSARDYLKRRIEKGDIGKKRLAKYERRTVKHLLEDVMNYGIFNKVVIDNVRDVDLLYHPRVPVTVFRDTLNNLEIKLQWEIFEKVLYDILDREDVTNNQVDIIFSYMLKGHQPNPNTCVKALKHPKFPEHRVQRFLGAAAANSSWLDAADFEYLVNHPEIREETFRAAFIDRFSQRWRWTAFTPQCSDIEITDVLVKSVPAERQQAVLAVLDEEIQSSLNKARQCILNFSRDEL